MEGKNIENTLEFRKQLEYVNLSDNPDPSYSHVGDSGFDLRAWITEGNRSIVLESLERRMVHTGLYFKLPEYTELQVRPRSGCSIKEGLSVINTPGTCDEMYRGEVCVLAVNLSNSRLVINSGDRIAQGVLCPVYNSRIVNLSKVDKIDDDTERGSDGFGSTGKK